MSVSKRSTVRQKKQTQIQTVSVQGTNDTDVIVQAVIQKQIDPESLAPLLDFKIKTMQIEAKQAFDQAFAKFQSECPAIPKSKKVKGKNGFSYNYAPIDKIKQIIKEPLTNNGLSLSYSTSLTDSDVILMHCTVKHVLGHQETSTVPLPIMRDGHMNDTQKVGSTFSFAKRYATEQALGIETTSDSDAQDLNSARAPEELKKEYKDLMAQADVGIAQRYAGYEERYGGLDKASEKRVQGWVDALKRKIAAQGEEKLETGK